MRTTFCTVLLLLAAITAHAALPAGIVEAFAPAEGVIIKGVAGEYLLDLGSQNGVRDGDLIAVLSTGDELRHPVSKAVIGRLEQARTFLRVVRVKPDFCWAKPLTPDVIIRPAEVVRRYAEVPALFVESNNDNHPLFSELQLALPHLAWRPWGETTLSGPGLRFSVEHAQLSVRDEVGTLLGAWPLAAAVTSQVPAPAASGKFSMLGPKFPGKAVGLAISDLDNDGQPEVAIALEDRVEIGRSHGQNWTPLWKFKLPGAVKALTLDAGDLDADGRAELLVTAVRGDQLASQVWRCNGADCQAVATNIPWYFRVLEVPGSGRIALAQADDPQTGNAYFEQPFRIELRETQLVRGDSVPFPTPVTLHGSQPLKPSGAEPLWAWLDSSDELTIIDPSGKRLWEGTEKFGGGETFIDRRSKRDKHETQRSYLRSRIALDNEDLILPQNTGLRTLSHWRKAEKSRLVALRWNGYGMDEIWSTPLRDGYLADFAKLDLDQDGQAEYLLVGTLATGLFGGAQSALFMAER